MADKIIHAVETGSINSNNISFQLIRSIAGLDHGVWEQLGRGRNILTEEVELDQYLYSYGLMVQSQWNSLLANLDIKSGSFTIVDYACGQGLASLLLRTKLSEALVNKIVLIEPSEIALKRAKSVVKCCYPTAEITLIHKELDNLTKDDLDLDAQDVKIHLFSNILDMDVFDHIELFKKIFQTKGSHHILAVSHDRNHHGGSHRLESIYNKINRPQNSQFIKKHEMERFQCSNGQPAISFKLLLEL